LAKLFIIKAEVAGILRNGNDLPELMMKWTKHHQSKRQ